MIKLPTPISEQPIILPLPFAGSEKAEKVDVADEQTAGNSIVNLANGFSAAYSKPQSQTGQYVTRGQINGIGRLITANETRKRLGGINTFNPYLVAKTGGYAKDAILDWWDERNQLLCKVISLVNDNKFDFTERDAEGFSRGPDGINWALCSPNAMIFPDYDNGVEISPTTTIDLPTNMTYVSTVYEMPFDGFISVRTTGNYTVPCSLFISSDISKERFTFDRATMTGAVYYITFTFHDLYAKFFGVLTADVYNKCRHSLYLAISEEGIFDSDLTNFLEDSLNTTFIQVSSSGSEGSGGTLLIPMKKGTKFRLAGQQTYTQAQATDYSSTSKWVAIYNYNKTYPENLYSQYRSTVMSNNDLKSNGSITVKSKIIAYPAIGPSFKE